MDIIIHDYNYNHEIIYKNGVCMAEYSHEIITLYRNMYGSISQTVHTIFILLSYELCEGSYAVM